MQNIATGAGNARSRFYYQLRGANGSAGSPTTVNQLSSAKQNTESSIAPLLYHVNELRSGKPTVISLDPSTAENFLRMVNTARPALQVVEVPFEEEETTDDTSSEMKGKEAERGHKQGTNRR